MYDDPQIEEMSTQHSQGLNRHVPRCALLGNVGVEKSVLSSTEPVHQCQHENAQRNLYERIANFVRLC